MTEHIRHIAILLLALSAATAVMMAVFRRPAPQPMNYPTLAEFQDHGKAERKKALDAMRITKMAIELAKARATGRQEQAQ